MSDAPDNVVRLHVAELGDGVVIAPDQILEVAAGKYRMLTMVGETHDGEIQVMGSHSGPESVVLLAYGQNFLVQNMTAR